MKKTPVYFSIALTAWSSLSAEPAADSQNLSAPPEKSPPYLLEAKAGYFNFGSQKMRKIYDHGGLDLQLSGSFPIVHKYWYVYASVEYLQRHGKSLGSNQKTEIYEVPLSLGIRPIFKVSSAVDYYLTLGPRYFFVHVHNHSSFVPRNSNENGLGGFTNTGFLFHCTPDFFIDIFGEYSYKRLHFHTHKKNVSGHTVQVGGYTFGGGLGYRF